MSLISLQGKIWMAERSAQGKALKQTWVGNAPTCELQLATETTNVTESFSGNRLQYGQLDRGKTATINLTLDEWLLPNLIPGAVRAAGRHSRRDGNWRGASHADCGW